MYTPFEYRKVKVPCDFCGRTDYNVPFKGTTRETAGLVFCDNFEETTYRLRLMHQHLKPSAAESKHQHTKGRRRNAGDSGV